MSRPYREATATKMRYGPNSAVVAAFVNRVGSLTPRERARLAAPTSFSGEFLWSRYHAAEDLHDPPACGGCSVSRGLAERDIDAALGEVGLSKRDASRLHYRLHRFAAVMVLAGEIPSEVAAKELRPWLRVVDPAAVPTIAQRMWALLATRAHR